MRARYHFTSVALIAGLAFIGGLIWSVDLSLWLQIPITIIGLLVIVVIADSYIGDLAYRNQTAAEITELAGPDDLVIIACPGSTQKADFVFRQYRPLFAQYGRLLQVEYPRLGYDDKIIADQLIGHIKALGNPLVLVIGISLGCECGISFLRKYYEIVDVETPSYFLTISGPTDKHDDRIPNWGLNLTHFVRGGPLVRLVGNRLWPTFAKLGPTQQPGPGSSVELIRQHENFMTHFDIRGGLAQIRASYDCQPVKRHEFEQVTALLVRTQGDDALIKEAQAITKLQAAFPQNSVVATAPGEHGNVVENPEYFGELFKTYLDFITSQSGVGST
jgi:hypothetical protein